MRIYLNLQRVLEAGYEITCTNRINFEAGVYAHCNNDGASIEVKCDIMGKPGLPLGIEPKWVSHYSFREYVSRKIKRRYGIYRLWSAQLTFDDNPNSTLLEVNITSSSIKDAQVLFERFMVGNIFPNVDFEKPQIERPLQTIRDLLKEIGLIIRYKISISLTNLRVRFDRL